MKVTKHLLEQFISLQGICKEDLLRELNKIGLEVESFAELRVPNGVVVGKVLSKRKHPDADKLSVCDVDVGIQRLQIVCGASNVEEDQFVAVALEGSRLQTPKRELLIRPTQLRGVESCGMLCSSAELGFPKVNDGIMVLDESIGELKLGRALNTYHIFDNFILELGLTPNRGDCLSVLGVARDLSVAFGIPLRLRTYRDENLVLGIGRVLQITNEGHFSSSVLYKVAHLKQVSAPLEVVLSLGLCDLPIQHNLQDVLEYAMHNVGVLLRIYPFEYFCDMESCAKGEILLKNESGIDYVCGLGGQIAVGISPMIKKDFLQDQKVVLEASFIDPLIASEIIYQNKDLALDSAMTYKSTRGSNPDLLLGMQYLCDYLIQYTQIEVYSSHHSVMHEGQGVGIKATFEAINLIVGQEICKEEVTNLLKKIGFRIEASCDDTFFMAFPPFYRHDIKSIQDVAEEILRFYGIDRISNTPLVFKEQPMGDNQCYFDFKQKRNLIKKATALGFCETLHYVFVQRQQLQDLGFETVDAGLDILNPITNELNTLRTSLIPAMLESIARNENFGFKAIALCESGICYNSWREEVERIAFVVNQYKEIESFPHSKGIVWDLYSFASTLINIIGEFELEQMKDHPLNSKLLHPYQSAWIVREGKRIGYLGKLNPYGGFGEGYVCEMLLKPLLQEKNHKRPEFSKFQASMRDLTIMIDSCVSFAKVKEVINHANVENLVSFYPLDLYKNENLGTKVALSIRFILQSIDKTLQEEDLNRSMQSVLEVLEEKLGASLRQ